MNEIHINDLGKRLERIEEVLAAAAANNFSVQIEIDYDACDELTSVETGIDLLIRDLHDEMIERRKLADELEKIKKG
ncbi:hypothetical protein JXM67_12310 [candidate division WOR-3 bacterium]|nr:hypothetical protein [candidate division WOR-3 bacterium]